LLHDRFGGRQIPFHQDGADGEHVADVVEAVADVVGGEVVRRLEIDANEIADRVVVLGAIETAQGDAARIALAARVGFDEDVVDGFEEGVSVLEIGSRLLLRRHLAGVQHLHDFVPFLAVLQDRLLVGVIVQREVGVFLLGAVTLDAMFRDEGDDDLFDGRPHRLALLAGGLGDTGSGGEAYNNQDSNSRTHDEKSPLGWEGTKYCNHDRLIPQAPP